MKRNALLASEAEVLRGVIQVCHAMDIKIDRQNTGGAKNPKGQFIRFGSRGNADLTGYLRGSWGIDGGKRVDIECKREGYNPLRGAKADKARFLAQLAKLKALNEAGGIGFWTDSPDHCMSILEYVRLGYRIAFDADHEPEVYKP